MSVVFNVGFGRNGYGRSEFLSRHGGRMAHLPPRWPIRSGLFRLDSIGSPCETVGRHSTRGKEAVMVEER